MEEEKTTSLYTTPKTAPLASSFSIALENAENRQSKSQSVGAIGSEECVTEHLKKLVKFTVKKLRNKN